MAVQKPSIPKGTRDFSPQEMVRRNYIFDTIRSVYKKYGYLPIETPAMENLSTLMGKYGDEGDKLIFKILSRGDKSIKSALSWFERLKSIHDSNSVDGTVLNAGNINPRLLEEEVARNLIPGLSEEALRYDLTVPFARYVVMNQNEIAFPFKRYQIQPVWRAERPQKGRYREFYQCDADVIGSNSLLSEIELIQIIDEVFTALKLPVEIKINNRKILTGIIEELEIGNSLAMDVITALDKLEKIHVVGVKEELLQKGLTDAKIDELINFIDKNFALNISDLLSLSNVGNSAYHTFCKSEIGRKGIQELRFILEHFMELGSKWSNAETNEENSKTLLSLQTAKLKPDFFLARGLNYYTGTIFEVKAAEGGFKSSICGGGRYDDLTGIFGLPNLSGVGISFGADRIYDVLNELNLYPEEVSASTKLLFVTFSEADQEYCLSLLQQVRKAGIAAELYPDAVKMQKQMKYADAKGIPFVAIVGENERKENVVMLKNMKTGEQEKVPVSGLTGKFV